MAVRPTMAALIAEVRLLIGDPAATSQQFTDQQVQDALDHPAVRRDFRLLALKGTPIYVGATISYLDYFADWGWWESDVALYQYLTVLVTPATSELITGHWVFAVSTLPPVYLIGKSYDVYRAAANLLEMWAALLARQFAFTSDGQTFNRQQASQGLVMLAKQYRKQQRPTTARMVRDDLSDGQEADMQHPTLGPTDIDYFGSGDGS